MAMKQSPEDLFPLYALGALNEEERAQVEAYLEANPDSRSRLVAYQDAADALAELPDPEPPPSRVKAALMERVRSAGQAAPEADSPPPARADFWTRLRAWLAPSRLQTGLSLAAIALALAAGLWSLSLRSQVAELQAENARLAGELQTQREVLAQISAPESQALAVTGTEARPQAGGQLIAAPDRTEAVLLVRGLAVLDPDQTYQIWLIRDQLPASAGFLTVNEEGIGVVILRPSDPIDTFQAVGVSIEPQAGSDQPTGDIVLLGEISL